MDQMENAGKDLAEGRQYLCYPDKKKEAAAERKTYSLAKWKWGGLVKSSCRFGVQMLSLWREPRGGGGKTGLLVPRKL